MCLCVCMCVLRVWWGHVCRFYIHKLFFFCLFHSWCFFVFCVPLTCSSFANYIAFFHAEFAQRHYASEFFLRLLMRSFFVWMLLRMSLWHAFSRLTAVNCILLDLWTYYSNVFDILFQFIFASKERFSYHNTSCRKLAISCIHHSSLKNDYAIVIGPALRRPIFFIYLTYHITAHFNSSFHFKQQIFVRHTLWKVSGAMIFFLYNFHDLKRDSNFGMTTAHQIRMFVYIHSPLTFQTLVGSFRRELLVLAILFFISSSREAMDLVCYLSIGQIFLILGSFSTERCRDRGLFWGLCCNIILLCYVLV